MSWGITLPSVSDIASSTAANATAFFNQFWPLMLFGLGVILGAAILIILYNAISGGIHKITRHTDDAPWRHEAPGKYHNPWETPLGRE